MAAPRGDFTHFRRDGKRKWIYRTEEQARDGLIKTAESTGIAGFRLRVYPCTVDEPGGGRHFHVGQVPRLVGSGRRAAGGRKGGWR